MAKEKKKSSTKEKDKKHWYTDDKFKVIVGVILIFTSLYLTWAFVSYLFNWQTDQSVNYHPTPSIKDIENSSVSEMNPKNLLGTRIAKLFLNDWFGISSLAFPLVLFVAGLRLMNVRLMPLRRTTLITIFGIIIASLCLSYLTGKTGGYLGSGLGGAHGFFVTQWLYTIMGKFGTGLLLAFIVFVYLTFTFNSFIAWFLKLIGKIFSVNKSDKTEESEKANSRSDQPNDENNQIGNNIKEDLTKEVNDNNIELIFEKPENIDTNEKIEVGVVQNDETPADIEENINEEEIDAETLLRELGPYDPKLDLSNYKYPHIEFLEDHKSGDPEVTNEELISNKNKIVETLANYKIQIDRIKATIGPTVTLYEIVPAPGIRISKIKSLEDDIALSLSALGIRIIAPIPGRGTIGIEVPNRNPEVVSMKSAIAAKKFQESSFDLAVVLGKTIQNETFVFDLTKMPHLLVAGATGQGKSVGLNAIITSLLYKKHPSELKFVLIDPKKVELTLYSKLEKHFLAKLPDMEDPIITDTQKVINTLNSLTVEMDNRYDLLKKAHVRNIKEYNTKFIQRRLNPENGHRYLPYIVLVIDEFADLIMTAGREIETPLARLAQLARAIGIHLIIATQRPTTNIITGVIKANFPARIAFRVTSMIDSRTILDGNGANQLIGRGDMLISTGSDLLRIQCAFIDTSEIDKITDFISSQQGYPTAFLLPEVISEIGDDLADVDLDKRDSLFDEAARLIVLHQQGSTSLIQRKFSIGYNRAGRIMDQLEAAGIVGQNEGSKARQVLIVDELSLEQILRRLSEN
jgi:DNA segregation ATPase FtsK/SpoIIIE, S-DNA-T family